MQLPRKAVGMILQEGGGGGGGNSEAHTHTHSARGRSCEQQQQAPGVDLQHGIQEGAQTVACGGEGGGGGNTHWVHLSKERTQLHGVPL